MQIENSNRRIAKNTLFLYTRLAVVMVVNLYMTRVLLEVLGIYDYGVYNVVCGFVALFGFLNTSMSNGTQRFYNYELGKNGEEALKQVYNNAIIIQSILAVIIVLFSETIGLWYVNTQMDISPERLTAANWIFQFSIISLIFVVLQIPYSAAIIAYERMDFFAIVSILDAFIKLAFTMLLPYLNGDRLIVYGLMIMAVSMLNFICYYIYCHKRFQNLRFNRSFNRELFKSMLQFSGWNIFGSFAYVVKGQGVNVLLNAFFGVAVNAANGIAMQVSSAIQTFASNLIIAFKPQLTQSYAKGDYERTEQLMFSMSKISYILMSIIAIPIIIEIDYVLYIWLKHNIPDHTATFTILTIVAITIGVFNTPVTQMIHATGKMRTYQITTGAIMCSILPISWVFLKLGYGATSVFVITIIVTIINQVASLIVLHNIFTFNISKYVRSTLIPCSMMTAVALCLDILIKEVMPQSLIRLLCVSAATCFILIFMTYITLCKAERDSIRSYFTRFIKSRI